ncbi:MAG TPA: alpha/beta hydrolase [Vicinamibacterales bacterium]|nr:alpha/beta hydrolase [Vicinamibacterales bacterium]
MKRIALGVVVAASTLLAGAASAQTPPKAGHIEWQPLKFATTEGRKQTVDAEAGILWVEENWQQPNGRLIGLRLVRLPATTTAPGDPVVYLAGGPGGSGTRSAAGDRFPLFMKLRHVGHVIALDQRGVLSIPFPACRTPYQMPLNQPLSVDAILGALLPVSRACAERWTREGVDLAQYHTNNSADDLEALRTALGAERLNLIGISYGTHLGLATLKKHPKLTRRAVFAGTEGLDDTLKLPSRVDAQFDRIARLADADPAIRRATGGLRSAVQQLLETLRAAPRRVSVKAPNGDQITVTVGPADLQAAIVDNMNERDDIAELPARVVRMIKGDFSLLALWSGTYRNAPGLNAMSFTMDCASGATAARRQRIEREASSALVGNMANAAFPAVCEAWPHVDLGDAYRAPATSDVPTLFLSGTLDGRTPPEQAEDVRAGFASSWHVRILNGGHDDDLLISSPLIGDMIVRFLLGEAPGRDTIDLGPIRFRRP